MDDIKNYLFFDIETHRVNEWDQLSPKLQQAFINHNYDPDSYDTPAEHYMEIAGLHAEFSHVICVCFGYEDSDGNYRSVEICDLDEKSLLKKCASVFKAYHDAGYYLAGHNINSCDIPYMMKRYIINGMKVPKMLNHVGMKPWDIGDLDSMQLWKFGMWTAVSLETLCACLNIPCKSEEVSGANLYKYRIDQIPLDELVKYCAEDVLSNYTAVKKIFECIY